MDVHSRSASHPLLGRLRSGAPRLGPLSPELHTSDCSSACPGSSTWVDKVPSRDTPSLNLAGCQGGVHPDNPQVARNQSARRWRSSVKVPNVRTGSEARSGPTAATCIFAPTSMAAARGWMGDIAREWTGLFVPVMPASPCVAKQREGLDCAGYQFPN